MDNAATLQARFGIPGAVNIAPAAGGLPAIAITTPQAEAMVYLHGAHITHFQPRGRKPILFASAKSQYAPGKAIRGGVPVIFPWFGPSKTDPKLPSHGFARTMSWELSSATQNQDGSMTVSLTLRDDDFARKLWPHPFELEYRITVADSLTLELRVRNLGPQAFTFEEALHSYFAVKDVRQITLTGLAGRDYLDKTQNMHRFRQTESELEITKETDRHYLATSDTVIIHDPIAHVIRIAKENSQITVVWNPWIEKAKSLSDLGDDEWQNFVCVETANAYDYAIELAAGATHSMSAKISAG